LNTAIAPVVREIEVKAPADVCFTTFVDRFDRWWPHEHHLGEDRTIVSCHIEPQVGGPCYDVDTDGGECVWATVLAYEPPRRLVLAWHIQGDWATIDGDLARSSEVEVTFTPLDDGRTRVRLEHGHLERHGAGGEHIAGSVSADGGWGTLLGLFAAVAEG
jgi:uncharacterized protein YndB with AHSA1/START domain